MDSLRFPAALEIYRSKRCRLLGNFDAHLVNREKAMRFCRVFVHHRDDKSFVVSSGVGVDNRWSVDSNDGSHSVTRLVEEFGSNEGSDTSLDPRLPRKDAVSEEDNVGRKKRSERKIWSRVAAMNKLVQRRDQRRGFPRNKGSMECVRRGVDEIKSVVFSVTPESGVERCNSVLRHLEDKRHDDKVNEFFQWMKSNGKLKKNVVAYNLALRALARREDWHEAKSLIGEMVNDSGCELTAQVFNALIFVCAKKGLVSWGSKWFALMLEKGVEPNIATIGMLMGLYQRNGSLSQAEFTFDQMRSYKIQCITAYSSMITIYSRLGLYEKSEEIIRLMEEEDGVVPDVENWLVRLNAYSQQGKLDEADSVLKSMEASGVSPNIVAYNTLITGYGKVSKIKDAVRLFKNLNSIGLKPDETTYRSMVEGFGRADDYKEALWYYRELKISGFSPNSSNFYTMINLQARHRDEQGAIETIKDMREMGCQYSSILSSLLQAYEKAGRIYEVPPILEASFYENILLDPTSCSILVMSYVQNSLMDEALRVLQEKRWVDSNFEGSLYHLLICFCKEGGHFENAVKIYTQMPKSERNPNLHITCSMINIYSSMNRFTDAEDLFLMLKSSEITFDMIAYSIVVRMYIRSGSLQDACTVLDMMEKRKDIVPDTYLFRDMLRTYQQCGMHEKLASVYYRLLKSKATWDEAMYNCVINCCAGALPVDELSRLFNEMIQCGFVPNTITINVILDVYGKSGLLKKAKKVFWMARKQRLLDTISYNTIIATYGHLKDFKSMRLVVNRMKREGLPVSIEAYNSMLDAYGKEDLLDEFNQVLEKMKEVSCPSDHYTYNIMMNIYGKKGWIEEVSRVLDELKEHGLEPDLYSYNTLIKAYGIAGMAEDAVNIVQEMRSKGIKPDFFFDYRDENKSQPSKKQSPLYTKESKKERQTRTTDHSSRRPQEQNITQKKHHEERRDSSRDSKALNRTDLQG